MPRSKSIILDFQAQTKARIAELKDVVKTVQKNMDSELKAGEKIVKQAEKEVARLERTLPKPTGKRRGRKPKAEKVEAKAEPISKSEVKRQTIQSGSKPRVTGTFGLGALPKASPVAAPAVDAAE